MTGEVTIRGRVLPIGGLNEKTMAAYRAGVKTVIIPKKNEPDLEEIEPKVREALEFVTVDRVEQVLEVALENVKKAEIKTSITPTFGRKTATPAKARP